MPFWSFFSVRSFFGGGSSTCKYEFLYFFGGWPLPPPTAECPLYALHFKKSVDVLHFKPSDGSKRKILRLPDQASSRILLPLLGFLSPIALYGGTPSSVEASFRYCLGDAVSFSSPHPLLHLGVCGSVSNFLQKVMGWEVFPRKRVFPPPPIIL